MGDREKELVGALSKETISVCETLTKFLDSYPEDLSQLPEILRDKGPLYAVARDCCLIHYAFEAYRKTLSRL